MNEIKSEREDRLRERRMKERKSEREDRRRERID